MIVAKPFRTDRRRFAVGQTVTPADITGAVTFEVWCERGFIESEAPTQAFVPLAWPVPAMPAVTESEE